MENGDDNDTNNNNNDIRLHVLVCVYVRGRSTAGNGMFAS